MQQNKQFPLSRRAFMKGLSACVAAPLILPTSALAKGAAANELITVGVIGTGSQGRHLMGAVLGLKKMARIVALCDVNKNNIAKGKEMVDSTYGDTACETYSDFREILARKDIDAFIVATPDHWHAMICVTAARAGKDIYCEKPLTWSLGEGRAVVKAVRENKVIFQVGSMQRSFGNMKQACELIRNGCIGKVHHIDVALPDGDHTLVSHDWPKQAPDFVDYDFWVGPAQWVPYHPERLDWNWRWWMGFGGGQMMDWIGHHGDIAHMGMGWDHEGPKRVEPIRWEVTPKSNIYNDPTRYKFRCTYKGGVTLDIANASDMPQLFKQCGGMGTFFHGENGQWVYVDRGALKANPGSLLDIKFTDADFRFRAEENHMRDFLCCVRDRKEPAAPVHAGHRSASIGHLGKIACTMWQPLEWDAEKEIITNNAAANRMLTRPYRGEWRLA